MCDINAFYDHGKWNVKYCNDKSIVMVCDEINGKKLNEIVKFRYVDETDIDIWWCDIYINDEEIDGFCVSGFNDTNDIKDFNCKLRKLGYLMFFDPPERLGLY